MSGLLSALGSVSPLLSGFGAAEDAKAVKKQIKEQRDAALEVSQANTKASLDSLAADTKASIQLTQANAVAQISALQYDSQTEEGNLKLIGLQGADALNRGLLDEFNLRRQASVAQGKQRAAQASTGVDVNSGSAAYLQEDTLVTTDLDALAIQQNAAREKFGFDVQAYDTQRKIGLDAIQSKSTQDVAAANIKGVTDVSAIRAKGIKSTAKANDNAIRKTASSQYNGISPLAAGVTSFLSSAVSNAKLIATAGV